MADLIQMALNMARAVNPELTAKAEQEIKKYSKNEDGLKKVIADYGGKAFVDSAADFVNKSPKIKAIFSQFGVDPNKLKNSVLQSVGNNKNSQSKPTNPYQDRLNKLK